MSITIARDGIELGALPAEKARELLDLGFLLPTDIFWEEGMPEWISLSQIANNTLVLVSGVATAQESSWLSAQTDKFLNTHWPEIRDAVVQKAGGITSRIIADDQVMTEVFTAAYKVMPVVVTLTIREKTFVAFCMEQRNRFLI